eukprot:11173596-Lingulodinium_polyedra.AAC.1
MSNAALIWYGVDARPKLRFELDVLAWRTHWPNRLGVPPHGAGLEGLLTQVQIKTHGQRCLE